ncbi:MAG: 3'-5' exonuclease, partial [Ignavibacteriales bacterium]|nr:3'-5' exonuclease [Ignavibacteriales bacterium]
MKKIELKNILIKDAIFSILDFETSGMTSKESRVIEVGLVKVKNYKIIDTYHTLINPEIKIPSEITKLTGITNLDVKKAPRFSVVADEISNLIEDTILVAHNFNFDYSFLKSEFNL